MSTITYRLATTADTTIMIEFRLKLLAYADNKEHSEEEINALKQNLESYFPAAIHDGSYIAWLAFDGNTCVAVSGMAIYNRPASFKCPTGKVGYILNMYTEVTHRKQGICSRLISLLDTSAIENNISVLALHATDDGEPIYRKHGFSESKSPVLEKRI